MATLITNIKGLVNVRESWPVLRGKALADLPVLENAYLIVDEGRIAGYGLMNDFAHSEAGFSNHYDASGRFVLPSWCDSHTHLVFAGTREEEFRDKIEGRTYAEIAAKGGGILASAAKLAAMSEEVLYNNAYARLQELIHLGTGAIEIKSGYGLTTEAELKMLRVVKRLKASVPLPMKASFLGAHAMPAAHKERREEYIEVVINEMLPAVAAEGLADYVDVFCEKGFFSADETERICRAGMRSGLKPKLHSNQLNSIGGVQAAVKLAALSVDHLETMTDADIADLSTASTIGTLLPTAAFFLRMDYQPARRLIDAGCAVALASDFNPGSSPSGNMNFVVALSCIQMRMLPEEAINAATLNGAHAMEVADEVGSISVGKRANLILTKPIPSLTYLPYAFGTNHIERVMLNGNWIDG